MCIAIHWPINICMALSVMTPSMEDYSNSYSQMKMVKFCLRNRLGKNSLSNLIKITIIIITTNIKLTDIKFIKNMDY